VIVLTGGAGFIGSCILSHLNRIGREDVVVVDHLDAGGLKKQNLAGKKFSEYVDKKEFLERVIGDKLPGSVDCVLHMGACSSTILQDARYYQENNYEYTVHLAQWALAHDARFIYASSAATYGDGSLGYKDDEATTRRLRPLNLYGESKHKFDLWVLDSGYDQRFVGLKFFNVFGPNEYHKGEMRSVVAKAFDRVVREGKIALFKSYRPDYKDGEQKRDFIYISDAVDIVMFFMEHPAINGIYNVGTGEARTWNDLARSLFAAVGKEPCIEYVDMPSDIQPRYQYYTQADMTKLRAQEYQKPFTSLEDAVTDYAGYLKDKRHL